MEETTVTVDTIEEVVGLIDNLPDGTILKIDFDDGEDEDERG